MSQSMKKWLYAAGGTLFVLVTLLIVTPMMVDPNRYRTPIAALVKNITGRQLTILGDVKLSLFPSLKLVLREVSLANGVGFGSDPMVRVDTVAAGVKFLPLLRGRVEVDHMTVSGLNLDLRRNREGMFNWADWLAASSTDVVSDVKPSADLARDARLTVVLVGGVEVVKAKVSWRDDRMGTLVTVDGLDLKTGSIHPDRPVAVTSRFRVVEENRKAQGVVDMKYLVRFSKGKLWLDGMEINTQVMAPGQGIKDAKTKLVADLEIDFGNATAIFSKMDMTANLWAGVEWMREVMMSFRGRMELDWARRRLVSSSSQFMALLKSNALPPAGVTLRMKSDLHADLEAQTVALNPLEVEGPAGMRVKGGFSTQAVLTDPVTSGNLSVERFDFRSWLIALGRTIPSTLDVKVAAGADASLDFVVSGQEASLSHLKIGLDDSQLTGSMVMRSDGPSLRFDWEVDKVDLDRFRPLFASLSAGDTPTQARSNEKESEAKSAPGWPVGWLSRELVVDGKVRIGALVAAKGHFTDVAAVVTAGEGVLTLNPLSCSLYGGRLEGKISLDARESEPQWMMDSLMKGVMVAPLLQEMAGLSGASGVGEWSARMKTQGRVKNVMMQNWNGETRLNVVDGVIPGVDGVARIRSGYAAFKRMRQPPAAPDETRFVDLSATAVIANGILINKDLVVNSPVLKGTGAGQVDFVQKRVDYVVNVDVATALQGVVSDAEKYQGLALPLTLRGSWDSLKKFEPGSLDFSRVADDEKDKFNRGMDKIGNFFNKYLK
ncbi:MAG: AsmA family protein [Magnetococcales bacterium]|nr:AsmA family protein [Magnetococcales bacterium]